MIAGIGVLPALAWWLGLAALAFVVIPSVVVLATGIVARLNEVHDYAADILEHGVGLAGNLDPIPELATTRDLVKQVGTGVGRYGAALGKVL